MFSRRGWALVAPLAVSACAVAQQNALNVYAQMNGGPVLYDVASTAMGPLERIGDYDDPTNEYNFDAKSRANYGSLGAYAYGRRAHPWSGDPKADNMLVSSSFNDGIRFSSGAGRFRFVMDLEGHLIVNGARFTTATVRLNAGAFSSSDMLGEVKVDYLHHEAIVHERVYSKWFNFDADQLIDIGVQLNSQIALDGFNNESMEATCDFYNTASMAFLDVQDANGNTINPTVVSDSGTQYRVGAVPEPATMAGFGAWVIGFGLRRRKRSGRLLPRRRSE